MLSPRWRSVQKSSVRSQVLFDAPKCPPRQIGNEYATTSDGQRSFLIRNAARIHVNTRFVHCCQIKWASVRLTGGSRWFSGAEAARQTLTGWFREVWSWLRQCVFGILSLSWVHTRTGADRKNVTQQESRQYHLLSTIPY